jgi:formate hydrogenlyase subunit 4
MDVVQNVALLLAQVVLLGALAPLLTGTIRVTKARLQSRRGAPVWQPYLDLRKLWRKSAVASETASVVSRYAGVAALAAIGAAACLVPTLATRAPLQGWGDLLTIVGLLALARFAIALAALDAGSAFGGMGSSREAAIAALAEPGLVLALAAAALAAGSTDLGTIAAHGTSLGAALLTPSHLLAAAAFGIVAVAETGHLPVDNPDTHLELTMTHEGMILEASGRRLALLLFAGHLRQALVLAVFIAAFLPFGMAGEMAAVPLVLGVALFVVKAFAAGQVLALLDATMPKLRILRLPEYLRLGAALAAAGLAARIWLPA